MSFKRKISATDFGGGTDTLDKRRKVVPTNSGTMYGDNNRNCGNTIGSYNNIAFSKCNISIPDEKRQVLEWLSPLASRERHQAVRDSRVEGVGDWLLRNQSFSTWRVSEDRMKSILFCYGYPGVGKTYIRYGSPQPTNLTQC